MDMESERIKKRNFDIMTAIQVVKSNPNLAKQIENSSAKKPSQMVSEAERHAKAA